MVKDRRIPVSIYCQSDMRQAFPFLVSIGTYGKVWKSSSDIQRDHISIKSFNSLMTSCFCGFVMNSLLECFKLYTRDDRLSFACVCKLMHDGNSIVVLLLMRLNWPVCND